MPSPFPGMDPYLEAPAFWSDFHARFLTYLCDAINERLPESYEARIDEKVNLIEASPDRIRLLEPDLGISSDPLIESGPPIPGGVATLEPVTIPHLRIQEELHERWIEILHRPERSLVAVLELLSPSSKEEPGFSRYRERRYALLQQEVHLIELDLLLAGRRLTLRDPLPAGDYHALISRADRRPDCQVYSWTMRHPLPVLPIPLRSPDPDLHINLHDVFTVTYDRARYGRSLKYGGPPSIGMSPAVSAWVQETAQPRPA